MANALEVLDTEVSRINFLKGIIALAQTGGIHESEYVFFQQEMISLGLCDETRAELERLLNQEDVVSCALEFDSKKQALFFIREGIQLCYVDGHYGQAERSLVVSMAERLGISLQSVEEIEQWVLEGIQWSDRGSKLLELEV